VDQPCAGLAAGPRVAFRRLPRVERVDEVAVRADAAEVVDPAVREATDQVFFGATVTYLVGAGEEQTISIVGIDEVDLARGRVSWISPIARAFTKAREGDAVQLRTPAGVEVLEIISVRYLALD
jgi:transcription elongation factor GreB